MKTRLLVAVVIFILILVAGAVLIFIPGPNTANAPTTGTNTPPPLPTGEGAGGEIPDLLVLISPLPNTTVYSPLTVSGKARGNWYFEASAPYQLKDAKGKVIAQGHVDAQGDWMTTEFVPFTAKITFPAQPSGSKGTLILKNDNPSGDPAKDKELDVPVTF